MNVNNYKEDKPINMIDNFINNNINKNITNELVNIVNICKYLKKTNIEKNLMFLNIMRKSTGAKRIKINKVLNQLDNKSYKIYINIQIILNKIPFKIYIQKSTVIENKDIKYYPKIFVSRENYYKYIYNTLLKFILLEYPKLKNENFNILIITHSNTCFISKKSII